MTIKTVTTYVGLPGSGKSTDATSRINADPKLVRVSRDDIRNMMHGGHRGTRAQEELTSKVRNAMIRTALRSGNDVVVDETNMRWEHLQNLRAIALREGAHFEVVSMLDVDIEQCIERDARRANSVGEQVIRRMWRNALKNMIDINWEQIMDMLIGSCGMTEREANEAIELAMKDPVAESTIGEMAILLTKQSLNKYSIGHS